MIKKIEVRVNIEGDKKDFEDGDIDRVIAELDSYLASYRPMTKDKSWFSIAK